MRSSKPGSSRCWRRSCGRATSSSWTTSPPTRSPAPRGDRGSRCRAPLSAALLARSQPDRAGLRQAQGPPAQGGRANRRRPVEHHRPTARPIPARPSAPTTSPTPAIHAQRENALVVRPRGRRLQLVPASGTCAIAPASTANATRSSGARLSCLDLPAAHPPIAGEPADLGLSGQRGRRVGGRRACRTCRVGRGHVETKSRSPRRELWLAGDARDHLQSRNRALPAN